MAMIVSPGDGIVSIGGYVRCASAAQRRGQGFFFLRCARAQNSPFSPTPLPLRRGHGTYEDDGELVANVSGVVERVNKLVRVRPLQARYVGDVGDVVVGRVKEVS
jgi:hypothetical protein